MKSILFDLYSNTETKFLEGTDSFLRSRVNLALEEIFAVLYPDINDKKIKINTDYIITFGKFCKAIYLDAHMFYLYERKSNKDEILYTLKHMTSGSTLQIVVEVDDQYTHAGILMDFKKTW